MRKLIPNQEVTLELEGVGSLSPLSGWTNSSGELPLTFTAQEEAGEAFIVATSDVLFQTDFISVNDQIVRNKVREKRAVGTHALNVQDVESWAGKLEIEMTHSISEEHHCNNTGVGHETITPECDTGVCHAACNCFINQLETNS